MSASPLLSLIVPVYNVAPYLCTCLDSLQAQTQPVDEIIVVDDGSTDDCPAILAEYAQRLPQMRVIRQENGGLSAARNTGMRHANGRYLAFVDSDDFVMPTMYAQLLTMAQADDLDIALCNAIYHFEGREPEHPIYVDAPSTDVMSGSEWLRQRLQNGPLLHMVWMHLYRRDFLLRHGFQFIPKLIHEDVIWTTRVLLAAERVRYDATPRYFYRIPIRHFLPEQKQKRLAATISSSIVNAMTLLEIAEQIAEPTLQALLRMQAVDGAGAIFHKIAQIDDAHWQGERYREIHAAGLFSLLWINAKGWRQHRRVVRHYLKSLWRLRRLRG